MIIFLSALCVFLLALLVWLALRIDRKTSEPVAGLLQQQVESLREQVSQSLSQNATLLQRQLESVSVNVRSSSGEINQRLDNAAKIYAELRGQLGSLSQANAQIQAMVKDVSTLQDILRPPKLRGGMGEVMLENLLRE